MADLAVLIVSYNSAAWLGPCLASVYAHAGGVLLDVVVIDNDSRDGSAELVERDFPSTRVLRCENRGFACANNRGFETIDAPFVLYLNPDAEIREGDFADLVRAMRERPEVGLLGCRQLTPDGRVYPTIRRFPNALRLLFESLGSERFPFRSPWLGERELDPAAYDRELACDWTSGSFMLARAEAVRAAGLMDERFFLYCEEPDLCLRIKQHGFEVRYTPAMTILHPWGKDGYNELLSAQQAYARRQYFFKHLRPVHRSCAIAALALRHGLRTLISAAPDRELRRQHRASSRAALRAVLGVTPPPFGQPPHAGRS